MEINCWHCGRKHALFWYVLKNGKRSICFRCDKVQKINKKDGAMTLGVKTEVYTQEVSPDLQALIPIIWSRGYRNKQQSRNQLQFVMTNEKPGRR